MGLDSFDELLELARIRAGKDEEEGVEGNCGRPTTTEEEGSVTPKAEENRMKPAVECPPAPRKSRLAKRKTEGYFMVPRDLASVFLGFPTKKIRSIG